MKSIIYISLVSIMLLSCEQPKEESESKPEEQLIHLSQEQLTYNNIKIGRLKRGVVKHKIKATGMVDVPPNYSIRLSSPLEAYVSKLLILPGNTVRKGQVIAHLTHPGIAQVQKDYLTARAQKQFLEKDLERKKSLLTENGVSQKSYDQLESEYTEINTRLKSLENELRRLDISPSFVSTDNITQTLRLKAPIDGVITDLFRKTGEYVGASEPLLSILNRDHEHIELQVFQNDLMKVKKGMPVELRLFGNDKQVFNGEVFLVNAQLDRETLSSNIHVHPGENFPDIAINSVVFGEIIYQMDSAHIVPSSEIIREGNTYFLFQKTAEGFKKVEVETGYNDGSNIAILGPQEILESELILKGNYYLNGSSIGGGGDEH
ncbi:MAG: efflux RND transporter periplasmic adaptor subunit [Marinoscillum sp.]